MNDLPEASDANWHRKAAMEEIDNLKLIRAMAWEEHTHSFKWLMASLLAINGGACLAIVGQAESGPFRLVAGAAFVIGILSALLVAVFGQRSIQKSLAPLQKIIGYWMTVADDGERLETMENQLNEELISAARVGYASRIAGWVSAVSFLLGVIAAGIGMENQSGGELLGESQAELGAKK